jgi:hypothetical protein
MINICTHNTSFILIFDKCWMWLVHHDLGHLLSESFSGMDIRRCIQKFPDWPPGARTANGTTVCHYVQLYRYLVSQSSEFCRHNPLCCFSTCVVYFVIDSVRKLLDTPPYVRFSSVVLPSCGPVLRPESHQMSKTLFVRVLIRNWNKTECLIHESYRRTEIYRLLGYFAKWNPTFRYT